MAWELELLYGFGDWSFYGFGDWSFSMDLVIGASVDLMECWIFSYRFFLSMHWRDEDRGLAGWLLDVQD
jgi:hypothetical protein